MPSRLKGIETLVYRIETPVRKRRGWDRSHVPSRLKGIETPFNLKGIASFNADDDGFTCAFPFEGN